MYSERQRQRFEHIVENADRVRSYMEGQTFEQFAANTMVQDAIERCLLRITEAAVRAGEDAMREAAPDVPLHVLRGFGNALRHDYDQIDLTTIWRTVQDDLPLLRARCAAALESEG